MFNKKQFLDFAFEEAMSTCNLGGLSRETTIEVLTTAMNGYAERHNVSFTAEEVRATIIAGLDTIGDGSTKFFTANYSKEDFLEIAFQEALNTCNLGGLSRETTIEVLTTAMNGYSAREGIPFTAEEVSTKIAKGIAAMKRGSADLFTANYSREDLLEIAFQEALNSCRLTGMSDELVIDVLTTAMNGYAVREGIPFTAEEIDAKIATGLAELKKNKSDYTLFADKTVL